MRKLFLVSAVFILAQSGLMGQDPPRISTSKIILFQQGFVLESLSGYGFSNAAKSPLYNIGSANPALLSDFVSPTVGISYQYNTQIDSFNFSGMSFQRVNNLVPQSGGLVYPFKDFRIGAAFSQKYSGEIRVENIPIRTIQNPDGTGQDYTFSQKNSIYSVSAIASYQLRNLLFQTDEVSFGLQFNMNYLLFRESIYRISTRMNADAPNWSFGLAYNYSKNSIPNFALGLYLETRTHLSDYLEIDGKAFIQDDITDSLYGNNLDTNALFEPVQFRMIAILPVRLELGYLVQVSAKLGFTSNFIYTWWEDIGESYLNRLDFSHNLMFNIDERNSLSVGFYYSQDNNESPYSSAANAIFLSTGMIHRIKILEIHLAVADSHLFTTKTRWQTIVKMGIGLNL